MFNTYQTRNHNNGVAKMMKNIKPVSFIRLCQIKKHQNGIYESKNVVIKWKASHSVIGDMFWQINTV